MWRRFVPGNTMGKRYKKRKLIVPAADRYAVAAIDPGGTTGVFGSVVTPLDDMKTTCWMSVKAGEPLLGQVEGDFRTQASAIANTLRDWFARWTFDYVAPANHIVVFEDWDTGRPNPGREIVSAWIAAGIDCLLTEGLNPILKPDQMVYQTASQAKGYATNERLKLWKLYELTVGKPHARDASRHWATKVNAIIK